jgi:pyruvate kinase
MLESMIEAPMPTRAEVTDVANAVFEEADAIMLSGATTVGKYPLKCIEVFDKIATRIERSGSAHSTTGGTSTRARNSSKAPSSQMNCGGGDPGFHQHGSMAQ